MLEELKEQVWQANLDLERYKLTVLTWGNVSGIDRGKGLIVIKPSGITYSELKPEDLVVLDIDGNIVEGTQNPSVDTPTHLVLYRDFPNIGGVTHAHSTNATAFAQACMPLPCFGTTHADHFYGEVPLTRLLTKDEVENAYVDNTGKVIVERFSSLDPMAVPGVLVAGHGPFTWGKDAGDSVKNSVALEEVAGTALHTLQLRPDTAPLPQYILDKHYFRKHGPNAYYGQK